MIKNVVISSELKSKQYFNDYMQDISILPERILLYNIDFYEYDRQEVCDFLNSIPNCYIIDDNITNNKSWIEFILYPQKTKRKVNTYFKYSKEQDAYLIKNKANYSLSELANLFNSMFKTNISPNAIQQRLNKKLLVK